MKLHYDLIDHGKEYEEYFSLFTVKSYDGVIRVRIASTHDYDEDEIYNDINWEYINEQKDLEHNLEI